MLLFRYSFSIMSEYKVSPMTKETATYMNNAANNL